MSKILSTLIASLFAISAFAADAPKPSSPETKPGVETKAVAKAEATTTTTAEAKSVHKHKAKAKVKAANPEAAATTVAKPVEAKTAPKATEPKPVAK